MSDNSGDKTEDLVSISRRSFMKKSAGLAALATATLASCTGVFGLLRLNNAPSYDSYNSNANTRKFASLTNSQQPN